jgi:hypothetical protein
LQENALLPAAAAGEARVRLEEDSGLESLNPRKFLAGAIAGSLAAQRTAAKVVEEAAEAAMWE